jgi:hypothetical protein
MAWEGYRGKGTRDLDREYGEEEIEVEGYGIEGMEGEGY